MAASVEFIDGECFKNSLQAKNADSQYGIATYEDVRIGFILSSRQFNSMNLGNSAIKHLLYGFYALHYEASTDSEEILQSYKSFCDYRPLYAM